MEEVALGSLKKIHRVSEGRGKGKASERRRQDPDCPVGVQAGQVG